MLAWAVTGTKKSAYSKTATCRQRPDHNCVHFIIDNMISRFVVDRIDDYTVISKLII